MQAGHVKLTSETPFFLRPDLAVARHAYQLEARQADC